jgi:dipeptidyl-peptidase-3
MKRILSLLFFGLFGLVLMTACEQKAGESNTETVTKESKVGSESEFQTMTEQFADLKILRYQIPAWDELTLEQKKLAYFLSQAGMAGRDIMYDQNYRHNLVIRRTLEDVYRKYEGDKSGEEWKAFEIYLKRIWFSNGIHHHYSYDKFEPKFSREYLCLHLYSLFLHRLKDQK